RQPRLKAGGHRQHGRGPLYIVWHARSAQLQMTGHWLSHSSQNSARLRPPKASRWTAGHSGRSESDSYAKAHPPNTSRRPPAAFTKQCRAAAAQRPCRHTESRAARWAAGAAPGLGLRIGLDGTAREPAISKNAVLLVAAQL